MNTLTPELIEAAQAGTLTLYISAPPGCPTCYEAVISSPDGYTSHDLTYEQGYALRNILAARLS